MGRHLDELDTWRRLANGASMPNVPIIYVGDIFHRWNSPPELINFALEFLPNGLAIPGNHDLPYHNYEMRTKSAYWTLVQARVIVDLDPGVPTCIDQLHNVWATPFPHGFEITPARPDPHTIKVALVHQYIWKDGHSFPGCPQEQHVDEVRKKLKGYDVAFFGDNHKGFLSKPTKAEDAIISNCGAFIRRKTDERDHLPRMSCLRADGSVKLQYLGCPDSDKWEFAGKEILASDIKADQLLEYLQGEDLQDVDFREELERAARHHVKNKAVRKLILRLLEATDVLNR